MTDGDQTSPGPGPGSSRSPGSGPGTRSLSAHDVRTALLIFVAVVLLGWALRAMAVILVPLVAAILIALAVMPVRDWVRAHVPGWLSWLGVTAAMGVVLLVLLVFFGGLYVAGRQLVGKVPDAAEQITSFIEDDPPASGSDAAGGRATAGGSQAPGDVQAVAEGARQGASNQSDAAAALAGASQAGSEAGDGSGFPFPFDLGDVIQRTSSQLLGAAGGAASVIMNAGLSILGGLVVIFFLTLLILLESGQWAAKVERLAGRRAEWALLDSTEVVASKFRAYVILQAGLGTMTGCLYAAWLWLWGVDLIVVWALLTFLMNFVPGIGSIISGTVTTAYALVTKDVGTAALVGAGILSIEQVMGNLVAPKLQSRNISLSPLVVFMVLIFWAWVWGIAGALLAVPVTVALLVFGSNVPALRPWALLLTDKTDMAGLDEATQAS